MSHGGGGDGVTAKILKFVGGFGVSEMGFALVLFTLALGVTSFITPGIPQTALYFILAASPVWLPIFLGNAAWKLWMRYIRFAFWFKQKKTMLEIRVPREITKSPRAMEQVLSGLAIGSREGTFINRNWEGKQRPIFSLEIASDGGQITFYIWTEKFWKDHIEAQIYAQYPELEVFEVEDYALHLHYDPAHNEVMGAEFQLTNDDVFPIRTYLDFELEKDPKEEFKIDPLSHVLEVLSGLKQGEFGAIQIIIQADKDKRHKHGTWFGKEDRWGNEAKEKIKEIRDSTMGEGDTPRFRMMTEGEQNAIKSIERSIDKPKFRTGIRWIYIADKSKFRAILITSFTNIFKQFSGASNGFKPSGALLSFDFPWQDWGGLRKELAKRRLVHAYQIREFFYAEYEAPMYPFYVPDNHPHPFVLTTEELASLFHPPSSGIKAPGVRRIPATKAEPPPNLPV